MVLLFIAINRKCVQFNLLFVVALLTACLRPMFLTHRLFRYRTLSIKLQFAVLQSSVVEYLYL